MKERVELNNNGRSIESHCKFFENRKWEPRYILCKLQCDLEDPLLIFYKNRKDRQKDKAKQSFLLRNYIGFEKSFPLKNYNQTLTVITKDRNIVLAFHLPETLLQWETWFKNVGGQSTTHYMQLLKFPNQQENPSFVNKEVRCHLHDSRLAIVYGIPAETLLYCETSASTITTDFQNHRVIITPNSGDGAFIFCCPSIEFFSRFLKKANEDDGSLNFYLNKTSAEGVWLPNINNRMRKHQDSISGLSGTFSGWFNLMNPTSPSINQSDIFSSRAAINTIGLRNPGMKTPVGSLKFLNGLLPDANASPPPIIRPSETPVLSRGNTITTPVPDSPGKPATTENSPHLGSDAKQRSTSLPEYVNVQHVIRQSPDTARMNHEVIHRKASTMTAPRESSRFSSSGEHQQYFPNRLPTKGRSMMDFSTLPYEEQGRHESWRRAKKFISAFSPKSQQDLYKHTSKGQGSLSRFSDFQPFKTFKKSSSTSALAFSPIESKTSLATTSSSSDLDEQPPPALNVTVTNPAPPLMPRKEKEPENIPAGLVRLREEGSLKIRGGVNIALARRLAAGINGSFTKYDGDRGTHVYPQTPEEKERKIEEFIEERRRIALAARKVEVPDFTDDPIGSVISKERDKMRQMERRASSVSFNKNNSVQLNHLNEIQKRALDAVRVIPPRQHSHSESRSIMSSSESLSSDARSKISIKKRSNSPPSTVAPRILPKQPSQQTLTLQKQSSSSIDSLNSHNSQQTTPTTSSVRLPTRIVVNNSSSTETSSEESSGKSQHYFETDIGPKRGTTTPSSHQSLGRQDSRRMSEGQGSNSSDAMAQARKGYFRKNNKTRRSNRHLDETSSTSP